MLSDMCHYLVSLSYYQYIANLFFANCIYFDPVCWLEFYIQLHKDKSDWSITYHGNHKNETKITTRKKEHIWSDSSFSQRIQCKMLCSLMNRWLKPIMAILIRPFGFLAPKDFYIFGFPNFWLPDGRYSRNMSCSLN